MENKAEEEEEMCVSTEIFEQGEKIAVVLLYSHTLPTFCSI